MLLFCFGSPKEKQDSKEEDNSVGVGDPDKPVLEGVRGMRQEVRKDGNTEVERKTERLRDSETQSGTKTQRHTR